MVRMKWSAYCIPVAILPIQGYTFETFSLLSGLWHYLFSPQNFHVLIIGLDSAGKTTLLENIKRNYGAGGLPSDKITPTIGMNLAKIKFRGAQIIFWDLGGQTKMRSMWEKYYLEANAVVYVIDAVDEGRLEEAKNAFDHMLEDESLSSTPILTLANKQDVEGALSPQELAETFDPLRSSSTCDDPSLVYRSGGGSGDSNSGGGSSNQQCVFGVSALTSAGLDQCMMAILRECRLHKSRAVSM